MFIDIIAKRPFNKVIIVFSFIFISAFLFFWSQNSTYGREILSFSAADICGSDNYIMQILLHECLDVAAAATTTAQNVSTQDNNNSVKPYDDFENYGTYTLSDGQTSPNGKWHVAYTGFGSVGVQQDPNTGNHYFFEQPKTATSKKRTYASMVLTTQQYSDFEMDIDAKTVAQLRQNNSPNPWETAWIFWHYTDEFHYYALTLKTNGIQIEKKDNNNHDDSAEIYLKFSNAPKLELDNWVHIKLRVIGNHITLWADGNQVLDFTDKIPSSDVMSSGNIGLYNEDAKVNFDNVSIKDITTNQP